MIDILTFNDLVEIGENERDRMEFVLDAIREHKGSELYKTAYDAELYYKHQNPTIMRFQKWVYNMYGQKVPDIWSPNNKIASRTNSIRSRSFSPISTKSLKVRMSITLLY